jgi:hypothetical protein
MDPPAEVRGSPASESDERHVFRPSRDEAPNCRQPNARSRPPAESLEENASGRGRYWWTGVFLTGSMGGPESSVRAAARRGSESPRLRVRHEATSWAPRAVPRDASRRSRFPASPGGRTTPPRLLSPTTEAVSCSPSRPRRHAAALYFADTPPLQPGSVILDVRQPHAAFLRYERNPPGLWARASANTTRGSASGSG